MRNAEDRWTQGLSGMAVWRRYALLVVITALYFLAGKLGLQFFGLIHPSTSAVWPPTGVAIAALLLFGRDVRPAVFAGAFLVNLSTSGAIFTSLSIAIGNTLEGVVAAYLVHRFAGGVFAFARAWDIFKFAALAALFSTTLSATIGVVSLVLGGYAPLSQIGTIWITWWLGDATGAILVTPLLLLWYLDPIPRWNLKRIAELTLLLATAVAISNFIFFEPVLAAYPRAFLCLPLLVWAAFRFGQREVATIVAILSVFATWATITGHGPFVMETPNESLLVLQVFMAMIAMMALPLAALVTERTALLDRERTARSEAEAANRTKDEFLAMLSHELRNPLGAISAATAVLDRMEKRNTDASRWLDTIRRQTQHLARLIDDLLDIARTTSGKMTLKCQSVNLADATKRCLQMLTSAGVLQQRRIEIQTAPVWALADPDRLDQIICNLITNAVKYTPPSGRIDVKVFAENQQAVFRIDDTGIGISREFLRKVFEPFAQVAQGPERAQGGLGLGLTLVRRLAELQNGSVDAHSDGDGKGSTFVVRLPLIDEPNSSQHNTSGGTGKLANTYRILIVEDNTDVRQALRALLEIAGHDVHEAVDGPTGIETALHLQPDFAIIDIGLPRFDGYEVARQIKAAKPSIRLIAMTGYGRDEDRQQAKTAGFDAHVLKPADPEQLQRIMDGMAIPSRPVLSPGGAK